MGGQGLHVLRHARLLLIQLPQQLGRVLSVVLQHTAAQSTSHSCQQLQHACNRYRDSGGFEGRRCSAAAGLADNSQRLQGC